MISIELFVFWGCLVWIAIATTIVCSNYALAATDYNKNFVW